MGIRPVRPAEQPRPVLVNNWEATYFDFDADKLYHIAEEAKNIGLDMFVLDACKVDYVKWDMNRSVDNVFSAALPRECQGEVYHRYVLAVYEMMESLVQRYPDLSFEGCSGGGGRFEAGMLYYSPQIWCSDNTDAIDRLKIQYGTSFGYPISAMGFHVSVCPNHQSGRITPFETRRIVASAGTFGYELDLMKMSEEEKKIAREQILKYKEMEHLVQTGDYYRLVNPFK